MALDNEEMNMRREKREARRRQQQRSRQRLQLSLIAAALVLILGAVFILRLSKGQESTPYDPINAEVTEPETTAATTAPTETTSRRNDPVTKIHIKAAGDLNITDSVVESGLSATGFDYTRAFMDVANVLSDADVTIVNLEGNICGEPYGSVSASAPNDLLVSLRNAGVDLVQVANSYSINNGLIGLGATLQAIRNAGLEPVGAYRNPSEFRQTKGYTICDVQGLKVAFVAFTKGVGGMGMPAGNEDCVNLLYKDYDSTYKSVDTAGITSILNAVADEKPDLTVALLHWGSENNDEISKTQASIVSLMKKKGVDVIIGTHPHLVQRVDFDQRAGTLVAYSLGDFYGDGARGGTNYSVILDIEVTKDADLNITRVTGYTYTPIYTLKASECDGYQRVVRILEAMSAYQNNYVDKVTADTYAQMEYSLQRITARINGT